MHIKYKITIIISLIIISITSLPLEYLANNPNNYIEGTIRVDFYRKGDNYTPAGYANINYKCTPNVMIVQPFDVIFNYSINATNDLYTYGYLYNGAAYSGSITGSLKSSNIVSFPSSVITSGYGGYADLGIREISIFPIGRYDRYGDENIYYRGGFNIKSPHSNPYIKLIDVGQNYAKLEINSNGDREGINARLERSIDLNVWNILKNNIYQTEIYEDSALAPDNVYYYRTYSPTRGMYSYQNGKQYIEVRTSADLSIVYAQMAKQSADGAKQAAEKGLEITEEINRNNNQMLNQINSPNHGLEALNNKLKNIENKEIEVKFPPTIEKLEGINNTTATKSNEIQIEFLVDNANICRYKINDSEYTIWHNIENKNIINVNLGDIPGMKSITFQFAQGNISTGGLYEIISPLKSKGIRIFKL